MVVVTMTTTMRQAALGGKGGLKCAEGTRRRARRPAGSRESHLSPLSIPNAAHTVSFSGGLRGEARRSEPSRLRASEGGKEEPAGSGETRELPIFPLSIVPVPFSQVPLHIFEARYRVLFNTLLLGSEDVDEGLANAESPFASSKEFGMCYVDKEGNIASVGSILQIGQHQQLEDGRLYIQNTALKRFTVTEVVEEKPVLVCKVQFIEDDLTVDDDPALIDLAGEVVDIFQKALALGSSLDSLDSALEPPKPEQLSLPPTELSYWLASLFPQDPQEQQLMLQIISTEGRLNRLKEIFDSTYQYHLARSSLKKAFD